MAVAPPFVIDETLPQSSNLLSQYPGQSQPFRDTVKSWLTFISDPTTGLIKSSALPTTLSLQGLVLTSTDAGATAGPLLNMFRDSASPAVSDLLGIMTWTGRDSAANVQNYGQFLMIIDDPVSTSEDAHWRFDTTIAGTSSERFNIGAGIWTIGATGTDKGTGTVNATDIFINGLSIKTDQFSGLIALPANKDYRLALNIPYGGTVTASTTRSASGTCTAQFKINTTNLGGGSNAVSTSEVTVAHASSNAFVTGDDFVCTISANAACVDLSFTLKLVVTF